MFGNNKIKTPFFKMAQKKHKNVVRKKMKVSLSTRHVSFSPL
jgi:hypothetical protein